MEYLDWELSWSKSNKAFRWILEQDRALEYLCNEAFGTMDMVSTKDEIGRLVVNGHLEITAGGVAYITANPAVAPVLPPADAQHLFTGYCRMCYRRANSDWRARDEHGSKQVHFVSTYKGRVKLFWDDHAPHLFHGHKEDHDGQVWLHNGAAYLA